MKTEVPEAESDSKAIIKELNDEVTSYIGLLDERDDIIRKVIIFMYVNT